MKSKYRHMRPYKPRRRRSSKILQKQQLKDLNHLLEMDLSTFLILSAEGTRKQLEQARVKLHSDIHKYGPDLEAIGRDLGNGIPEIVNRYLGGMKKICHETHPPIDPALIEEHRKEASELRKKAA